MSQSAPQLPSPLAPDSESRPGLLRVLGPGMAIAMVVGNVIGSGIFVKPGVIAQEGGSFPLIMTAWVAGGVLCILGSLCFAELAVMLPRAGGLYVYLREAYGRPVAFLFGWTEFLFGRPASIGALAVGSVFVFGNVIHYEFGLVGKTALVVGLIIGLAWINVLGVIWGGRFQALTTIIKSGLVGLLFLLPFFMMAVGSSGIDGVNYTLSVTPKTLTWTSQFAAVLVAVMWAYNGWHGITPIAEEVRNPVRNIPLALFGGIGLLIFLYVLVNIAYHGVLSMEEVIAAGKYVPQEMVRKLLSGQAKWVGDAAVAVVSGGIMCSMIGAMNTNVMNAPRVSFAMGRDDVFFRSLGRVHVNYRTPVTAIVVQCTMAGLLVIASSLLIGLFVRFQDQDIFELLTNYVIFSASIFYMLAVFSVFVLRRKHPDWERPYRTLGYPFVPIAYLSFYTWFLYKIFIYKPFESSVGILLIALGLPVYFGYRAWARRHPERLHDGQ